MYQGMKIAKLILSGWIGLAACLSPAQAQSGYPPAIEDVVSVDVLPGWRTENGTHMAAIRIRLAEGWKTYWRAPGEAGIPPSLNLQGSRNLASVALHWPVPEVFDTAGMQTIGYTEDLVLPMSLTPRQMGRDMQLKGKVHLGVCKDVCMPTEAEISVTLPMEGAAAKSPIKRALRARPDTAKEAGLKSAICTIDPIRDGLRVTARLRLPRVGRAEVVVIETANRSVWVEPVSTTRQGDVLETVADLVPASGKPFILNRSDLRLTVLAAGRGVDIRGCTGS